MFIILMVQTFFVSSISIIRKNNLTQSLGISILYQAHFTFVKIGYFQTSEEAVIKTSKNVEKYKKGVIDDPLSLDFEVLGRTKGLAYG